MVVVRKLGILTPMGHMGVENSLNTTEWSSKYLALNNKIYKVVQRHVCGISNYRLVN